MSKNKKRSFSHVLASSALAIPLVSAAACGGSVADDQNSAKGSDSSVDEFFGGLREIEVAPVTPGLTQLDCNQQDCPPSGMTDDGQFECSYKQWQKVEVFDSYAVFQPDLDRLYPGAMFRGGAYIEKGYLDEIVLPDAERAALEASFSLENTTESPSVMLDPPSLANYREERNRVLSGQNGNNPTTVQLSMQQVYSESHFSSAAGAVIGFGVGSAIGGVAGMFGAAFEHQQHTKKNMFMLRLRQQNYQVNLTPQARPGDYFYPTPDAQVLQNFVDDGVMPLIVSDLFYGRLVVCSVATHASEQETRDAWMSAIAGVLVGKGVGVAGGAAAALTEAQKQILAGSQVDCFVNGGAGSDAVKTVQGVDGIVSAILGSGDQSKATPGGLIGYRLTTLSNRELPISTTSSYTSEECLRTSGNLTMALDRIQLHGLSGDQSGNDQEIYGKVGITFPAPGETLTDCTASGATGGKTVMLFDRNRDQHIAVNNNFVVDLGTATTEAVNMRAGSKICVFADLRDYDSAFLGIQFNGDDSLGSGAAWVDVKQWNGEFGLNLKNSVAHLRFDLSP